MSSGFGLWLDTPANGSGAKSHPKLFVKSCQFFKGVTEPANFEALLGGFFPPNSAFSSPKSKLEMGARRNKVKGGEVGRQRDRGGRQLTTDQVSILGSHILGWSCSNTLLVQQKRDDNQHQGAAGSRWGRLQPGSADG